MEDKKDYESIIDDLFGYIYVHKKNIPVKEIYEMYEKDGFDVSIMLDQLEGNGQIIFENFSVQNYNSYQVVHITKRGIADFVQSETNYYKDLKYNKDQNNKLSEITEDSHRLNRLNYYVTKKNYILSHRIYKLTLLGVIITVVALFKDELKCNTKPNEPQSTKSQTQTDTQPSNNMHGLLKIDTISNTLKDSFSLNKNVPLIQVKK